MIGIFNLLLPLLFLFSVLACLFYIEFEKHDNKVIYQDNISLMFLFLNSQLSGFISLLLLKQNFKVYFPTIYNYISNDIIKCNIIVSLLIFIGFIFTYFISNILSIGNTGSILCFYSTIMYISNVSLICQISWQLVISLKIR